MMRIHANVNIAGVEPMMLGVWNRNKERQNSEHDDNESDHHQSFHVRPSSALSASSGLRRFAVSSSQTLSQTPPNSSPQSPTVLSPSTACCLPSRRSRQCRDGSTACPQRIL